MHGYKTQPWQATLTRNVGITTALSWNLSNTMYLFLSYFEKKNIHISNECQKFMYHESTQHWNPPDRHIWSQDCQHCLKPLCSDFLNSVCDVHFITETSPMIF